MRGVFVFIVVMLMALPANAATSQLLNIDLAQNKVHITTGFTGSNMTLFGVKQGRGDVVVVLEGPIKQSTVRRKDRIMGAWVNQSWVNFKTVPTYYDFAATEKNLKQVMSLTNLQANHIGVESLLFKPEKAKYDEATMKAFEDALIRIKQRRLLYPTESKKVNFLDDRFFRVDFHLPANVPRGEYTVRGMLVRDGQIVSEMTRKMYVSQVGLSSSVNKVAHNHGFAYGLLCVLVAVLAGIMSDFLIRRN